MKENQHSSKLSMLLAFGQKDCTSSTEKNLLGASDAPNTAICHQLSLPQSSLSSRSATLCLSTSSPITSPLPKPTYSSPNMCLLSSTWSVRLYFPAEKPFDFTFQELAWMPPPAFQPQDQGAPTVLVKCMYLNLHSVCMYSQLIQKSQQWPQDWKRSVFISVSKKGKTKECSNYCTIVLISHASKAMLKVLQERLQHYMNQEIPDVKTGFRKVRGTRDQIANIHWITEEEQRNSRKTSISASLTTLKPVTVYITTNCGKFLNRRDYPTTLPVS